MNFRKIILIRVCVLIIAAFSLQSCLVTKKYQRPDFEETQNLYRTDKLPKDSISMAEVSWKEMFTDPYLAGYIEKGLQNNLDVRIAVQQILAAEAYAKQAKLGYLPSIMGNVRGTSSYLSENTRQGSQLKHSGTDHVNEFELSGALSWEADIWGKILSNKRAFAAQYLQTIAAHKAVKTKLIADISTTYYQLLAYDSKLEITKKTIAFRQKSLETIKALKDAGQANRVAVDQYAAQLYNAQALLIDLKAERFRTENVLSILLGEAPRHFERSVLKEQKININPNLGLPVLLLRNRPDVIAAEYQLVNAFELTNVAKSNFYPSFNLSVSAGLQSSAFDNWFSIGSLFANLTGGITQPIFNRRKIKTQYEVAKAQQESALLDFKKSLLHAGKEVSDALYTYQAETEKFEYYQKELEALRKAESDSRELLDNGLGNYLDLLTAGQSALDAKLKIIDNKLSQLTTIVELYHALGGGWK